MYIPSFNKFDDQQEAVSFMQRYSFATIVTAKDGLPSATHLPFIVETSKDQIILRSHFAKANPQASDIAGTRVLVIFTEPHAYISPKNYEKPANVPTWNYIAIHAYGICKLMNSEAEKKELLRATIQYYDAGYQSQWDTLPEDYQQKMMNGIVGFEICVDDLQAKKKLSQNRSKAERENIIHDLGSSSDSNARQIAAYMSALSKTKD